MTGSRTVVVVAAAEMTMQLAQEAATNRWSGLQATAAAMIAHARSRHVPVAVRFDVMQREIRQHSFVEPSGCDIELPHTRAAQPPLHSRGASRAQAQEQQTDTHNRISIYIVQPA